MASIIDSAKRLKTSCDECLEGTQLFISNRFRDVLLREINSYLSIKDAVRFFGKTCRAIRAAHFIPSIVFTADHPLHLHIAECADTGVFLARPIPSLAQQAVATAQTIPVVFVFQGRHEVGSFHYCFPEGFKYTYQGLVVRCRSWSYLREFLARHPTYATAPSVVFSDGAPSLILDAHWNKFASLASQFPVARFRFDKMSASRACLTSISKNVEIGTLVMSDEFAIPDKALEWCAQRTTEKFLTYCRRNDRWAAILAVELETRASQGKHCDCVIYYSNCATDRAPIPSKLRKYVTGIELCLLSPTASSADVNALMNELPRLPAIRHVSVLPRFGTRTLINVLAPYETVTYPECYRHVVPSAPTWHCVTTPTTFMKLAISSPTPIPYRDTQKFIACMHAICESSHAPTHQPCDSLARHRDMSSIPEVRASSIHFHCKFLKIDNRWRHWAILGEFAS